MIEVLLERIARLEQRVASLNPVGTVEERDHEKGIRIRIGGTDAEPMLSPWIQPGDRSGASRYLPEVGEQVMALSHGGDLMQATVMPLTHSDAKKNPAKDADETVHHNRDGQRHSVSKGHVTDKADKKHTRHVGDEPPGKALDHELNKQLAGIRATLTQHDHNIAAVHDAASKMRQIAQIRIPELATLIPILNGDAPSLKAAAAAVEGKLQSYIANTFQEMMGKLTGGLLDDVMGGVQGLMSGDISGIVGQMASKLAGIEGGAGLVGNLLGEATALANGDLTANRGALGGKLDEIAFSVAGSAAEAAMAPLIRKMRGALGDVSSILGSGLLGGEVDAQKNLTKGMTKHYRLGGD